MTAVASSTAAVSARGAALFVNHGGGPMPLLGQQEDVATRLREHVRELYPTLEARPKAIVVVSAHYHKRTPTVLLLENPPMKYDYGGFPPEAYKVQYPAKGNIALGERILGKLKEVLAAKGKPAPAGDTAWGFDHGTFVPLMLMFPEADIPVIPVSVQADDTDAETQLLLGEALRPFVQHEGVLVLGSGASFHNFDYLFGNKGKAPSAFDDALHHVLTDATMDATARREALVNWRSLPGSFEYQPKGGADHFLPLLVAAAGGYLPASKTWRYVSSFGGQPYQHALWQ